MVMYNIRSYLTTWLLKLTLPVLVDYLHQMLQLIELGIKMSGYIKGI